MTTPASQTAAKKPSSESLLERGAPSEGAVATMSPQKLEDLLSQAWSDSTVAPEATAAAAAPVQASPEKSPLEKSSPEKAPAKKPAGEEPLLLGKGSRPPTQAPLGLLAKANELAPYGTPPVAKTDAFVPHEPTTLNEAALDESEVNSLILKVLLQHGTASGIKIASQIKLPFQMVSALLAQMKKEHRVVYKSTVGIDDFLCELTMQGIDQARRCYEHSPYCGSAPVPLKDYIAAVRAQSIMLQRPTIADMQRAFCDLVVEQPLISRLAQALRAGRGLFLYGPAGNGKTSFAERMTLAYGQHIWIPRAVSVDREIVRLYDACCHEEIPLEPGEEPKRYDTRWIRIRRPTVIAGGELTMDRLEVTLNRQIGVCEAPLQMKSNCGTLVIDDFGRQRMDITELLNRWIVPLEKRYDYINLPSGRTVMIPFDQLVVFSTNLEPKSLVDEAFLRRIPYKIDVQDPTEEEFRELFRRAAAKQRLVLDASVLDYVVERHYRKTGRVFRRCQPRDLIEQVRHYCEVHDLPLVATCEALDGAVVNYFSMMG